MTPSAGRMDISLFHSSQYFPPLGLGLLALPVMLDPELQRNKDTGRYAAQQNFPSLSSRTRNPESLGSGLVSVSDSDSSQWL